MGFSGQEYWSGLPFATPGDLLGPGIEPGSPVLQADSLLSEPLGNYYTNLSRKVSYKNLHKLPPASKGVKSRSQLSQFLCCHKSPGNEALGID